MRRCRRIYYGNLINFCYNYADNYKKYKLKIIYCTVRDAQELPEPLAHPIVPVGRRQRVNAPAVPPNNPPQRRGRGRPRLNGNAAAVIEQLPRLGAGQEGSGGTT